MTRAAVASPLGPLTLTEEAGEITRVDWGDRGECTPSPLLSEAARQLADYFAGARRSFDLPMRLGEGFDGLFRAALMAIPWGETRTYGDLARDLGISAQAAGQACGANPLPILVPCHRVLGAGGLGGYSAPGGIETKVALLRLEGAASLLI